MRSAARRSEAFATYVASVMVAGLAGLVTMAPAQAAAVSVRVHAGDGRALEGIVVTLAPAGGEGARPRPVKAVMDQVDRAFSPPILVVPAGSTVTFPNSDQVSHQVYSFSPARRFQLPLYRGTPYPPVQFDEPGIVTLGCNIHDDMIGYVVVTTAPHYGLTDRAGAWSSADVAPGDWRVTLWHPRLPGPAHAVERAITVDRSGSTNVDLRIDGVVRPAAATPKPRSWDSY